MRPGLTLSSEHPSEEVRGLTGQRLCATARRRLTRILHLSLVSASLFCGFALPDAARAQDQASGDHHKTDVIADCQRDLIEPLGALAGEQAPAVHKPWPGAFVDAARRMCRVLAPSADEICLRMYVATVPDPIESGLVYQFESALQAIRLGFEQRISRPDEVPERFFRDRAVLPWSHTAAADSKKPMAAQCQRSLPGLLLFRNSRLDDPEVALVFVVGETATSGVNAIALHNALLAIHALAPDAEVPIIGPTFSGSAYSLRVALDSFARATDVPGSFRVISGTATGADVPSRLRTSAPSDAARISYRATSLPGAATDCAYMWFLHSRLGVPVRQMDDGVRHLVGVASLRESGTEFGAGPIQRGYEDTPCKLKPELSLAFPAHISMLRDAYEAKDNDHETSNEPLLGRTTMLDVSLAQQRAGTEFESITSPRMRAALDLMLSQVLGELSRRDIKHVSVQATDVGDSIFLARKIHDVAPDVRLAFSEPDEILLHPQYRDSLLGSLVVSPYPFLGVSSLSSKLDVHGGFANAASQGWFNAVLAQRGAPVEELFNYFFAPRSTDAMRAAPLLVWISTIGRNSLVPMDVKAPIDCADTTFGSRLSPELLSARAALCAGSQPAAFGGNDDPHARRSAWRALNWVNRSSLRIDHNASLPHLWNLLYLVLCAGFIVDWVRQTVAQRRLARDRMPEGFTAESGDRAADRAIGRTSWRLYASIRRFLFVLAFLYMGAVYLLVFLVRARQRAAGEEGTGFMLDGQALALGAVVLVFLAGACFSFGQAAACFRRDFLAFARYVGSTVFPRSFQEVLDGLRSGRRSSPRRSIHSRATPVSGVLARITLSLGVAEPVDREQAARVSFAQLRFLALSTTLLALGFAVLVILSIAVNADVDAPWSASSAPVLALTVLRSVSLFSGVSPAAPALSCWLCVYLWCVGRMARLAHAHAMSRVSPGDGEADLVSTPIRLVLYPGEKSQRTPDEGYTQAERDLLNAIWRPIVGRTYVVATIGIFVLPFSLAMFKPLSTLEETTGRWLLAGALGLSIVLVGVTWIQLIQFWMRLQRVLGRTLVHELGPAFERLPAFARASLEELLSRSSGDLLRWVECARRLSNLLTQVPRGRGDLSPQTTDRLRTQGRSLRTFVQHALEMADAPKVGPQDSSLALPTPDEAETTQLAEQVISVASSVALLLEHRRAQAIGRARLFSQAPAMAVAAGHDVNDLSDVQDVPLRDVHALAASDPSFERSCLAPPAPHSERRAREATGVRRSFEQQTHSEGTLPANDSQPAVPPQSGPVAALAEDSSAWLEWQAAAEVSVATVATLLLQQHVRQFRYFMSTLVSMSLMLLLIVISYPFEPYRLLMTYVWVIVSSVVLTGLWIYIQLGRDRLMCHLTGKGSMLSTSFGLRLLGWVVVPLLSLAAAQYPDFANLLFKLFVPFARSLS